MSTDIQTVRDVKDPPDTGSFTDTAGTVLSPAGQKAMQGAIDIGSFDTPHDLAEDGSLTDAAHTVLTPTPDAWRMVHPRAAPEMLRRVEGETFPISSGESLSGHSGEAEEGYLGGGEHGG